MPRENLPCESFGATTTSSSVPPSYLLPGAADRPTDRPNGRISAAFPLPYLVDSARRRRMNETRGGEAREKQYADLTLRVTFVGRCTSHQIARVLLHSRFRCRSVDGAYQNRHCAGGRRTGEGSLSRAGSIAGATDLSSAAVRFIHRGPSRSRLRSRRSPFILFFPSSQLALPLRRMSYRSRVWVSLSEEVTRRCCSVGRSVGRSAQLQADSTGKKKGNDHSTQSSFHRRRRYP